MAGRGLGRGLEDVAHLAEDGPDLSSFVSAEPEVPTDTPRVAVMWMIFGSICFGTMNALVKWTSVHADVWMIIMVPSAAIAFAVAAFAPSRGSSLKVNEPKMMVMRCAVG